MTDIVQMCDRAIELVRVFQEGGFATEAEDQARFNELAELLPDPEFSRFLFWGPEGPRESWYRALTPEAVVALALDCQAVQA